MRYIHVSLALLAASCVPGIGVPSTNPVHDACAARAVQVAPQLAKIAAQKNQTSDTATTEYVNACEGQIRHDLDQTLTDLETIADAGPQAKDAQ